MTTCTGAVIDLKREDVGNKIRGNFKHESLNKHRKRIKTVLEQIFFGLVCINSQWRFLARLLYLGY